MAKNSRDYWKEREEEARKHTIQDEEVYNREIKRIYQRMYDNINREVNGFFVRYAGREGISISEAKKRVSKLDMEEYSRKAKEYVKNKDFSRQANEEMRIYNLTMKVNRLEMLKAHMGLEMVNSYQDLEDYMGRALNKTTMKELERQAGILGDSVSNPQRFAKQIVDGSFHHAKWSDRIWSNQQTLKMKLYDNLQVGLIQGRNPNVLARDIMKSMGASANDASRLMRTEMCRVQTDAQMATLAANGFEDYEFIAERSSRTCDQCLAMDGKHFKIKDAMPGENAPPLHPNCRCGTAAWMDDRAYEEWLDSGAAADGVSFKDFSANYKAAGETGLGFEEWNRFNENVKENLSTNHLRGDMMKSQEVLEKGISKPHFRTGSMTPEDYALAKEMWNKVIELDIPQKEKEWVYQELDNNLAAEEKISPIVCKPIGDYYYHAVNKGHNQYKIFKKDPIEPYTDWMDEVMSEIFGRNWRNFDT